MCFLLSVFKRMSYVAYNLSICLLTYATLSLFLRNVSELIKASNKICTSIGTSRSHSVARVNDNVLSGCIAALSVKQAGHWSTSSVCGCSCWGDSLGRLVPYLVRQFSGDDHVM